MRWESGRRSSNIEDRRGMGAAGMIGGGGIGMLILVLVISFISGRNPLELMQLVEQTAPTGDPVQTGVPTNDPEAEKAAVVLAETEETWRRVFQQNRATYQEPVLVLFERSVSSACGMASSAVGPFYCPSDHKLYLDLSFFRELDQRFGAPGDFAQAYVIAHEVGHHVQTLLGISERVHASRSRMSQGEANEMSVRQELQADCYAGVWGHHANNRNFLHEGDVEEGLAAAAAIGDDRLQRQGQGHVAPESWTHGSSEQRQRWLLRGLKSGDIQQCDTFSATTF